MRTAQFKRRHDILYDHTNSTVKQKGYNCGSIESGMPFKNKALFVLGMEHEQQTDIMLFLNKYNDTEQEQIND